MTMVNTLPTNITDGALGHAGIHNTTNATINDHAIRSTGWRQLALQNGWTGSASILRVGNQVFLNLFNLSGTAATARGLATIFALGGSGFSALTGISNFCAGVVPATDGSSHAIVVVQSTGGIESEVGWAAARGAVTSYLLQWTTLDPWPATLPGSPVT